MKWTPALVIAMTCMSCVELKRFHSIAGPFRVVVKHISPCYEVSDEERNNNIQFRLKEFHNGRDPEVSYNGSVYSNYPINNTLKGLLSLSSWSGIKGWQNNAHNIRVGGVCRYAELLFPSVWNKIMMAGFGEHIPCNLMAGFYKFEYLKVSSSDYPVKEFFYGKWKAHLHMTYGSADKECGCAEALVDTVPR